MSLIQNRRGLLGLWFSALLALALFAAGTGAAQEVKQIKLTEKHIQGFMAAYEDIAKVYDGAESDKPEDPKVETQAAAVAKKHGFASLAQYDDVSLNITMIMSGGGEERGPDAARSGTQKRKARSVQGKHRAGAKVLRPARAHHARARFEAATCGLETTHMQIPLGE